MPAKFNMRHHMKTQSQTLQGFDFDGFWKKIVTACNSEDYPRSKQQQDNRGNACLEIYKARRNQRMKEPDQLDPLQSNLPSFVHDVNLFERLARTCHLDNVASNWESCSIVSAALINPTLASVLNIPLDPQKGIEYAIRACNGGGNGMGDYRACLNLANMYERGNKTLGIMTDKRKAEEYRVKAWYQTEEGQKHIAMANLPTAGSVF